MRRAAVWFIWLWPHSLMREANGAWRMHGPRGRRRLGWKLTLAVARAFAATWPWQGPGRWGHSCRRRAMLWWWDPVCDALLRRGLAILLAWLWPGLSRRAHSLKRRLPAGTLAAILMGVTAVAAPNMMHSGTGELGGPRAGHAGGASSGGGAGLGDASAPPIELAELLPDVAASLPGGSAGGAGAGPSASDSKPPGKSADAREGPSGEPNKDDPSAPPADEPQGLFQLPTGLTANGLGGPVSYGGFSGVGGAGGGGSSGGVGSGGGAGGGSGGDGGATPGGPTDPSDPGPGPATPNDPPLVVEPPGDDGEPGSGPGGGVVILDPPPAVIPDKPDPRPGLGDPPGKGLQDDPPTLSPVKSPQNLLPSDGGDDLAAIPEPGAWLLMILGFGSIGAHLRRRRPAVLQR